MPTKDRRERERQQREFNKKWDEIVSNAPVHLRKRLGQPSALSEKLCTKGQHNAGWAKFDERGQNIKREEPEGLGANLERHENKEARALDLRERYPNIWGARGAAKKIVVAERRRRAERPTDANDLDYPEPPSVETIRRYMRDYPI